MLYDGPPLVDGVVSLAGVRPADVHECLADPKVRHSLAWADRAWIIAATTVGLAAVSWLPPIRKEEVPWPMQLAFYDGFFGAAIAGEGSHWRLATPALALSVAATGRLGWNWWTSRHAGARRRGSSGSSEIEDR
jgi:hypothetical protein